LALGFGEKGRRFMSRKIQYTDEPMGKLRVIEDFLPSPEQLAVTEESVKVTITLSKESVEFFKSEARKHNTQYQRMIRRLLDAYTQAHRGKS
jgi:predicted DNA binding CopG/RHH family protein